MTCRDKEEKAQSTCFSIAMCCLFDLQNMHEKISEFGSMVVITALSFLPGDFCPIPCLSPTIKGLDVKDVHY